jgi:hypothetical protein
LPACTKHLDKGRFGEQVSEGGYALAIFVEAVKMPRAEIWGASLRPNSVERALIYERWFYGSKKRVLL